MGIPRASTAYLWRAKLENVSLCYSFDNCGGVDFFSDGPGKRCLERGGHFINHVCTCDLGVTCNAKRCGDGQRSGEEECDDGNTDEGDGCDSECRVEAGYVCNLRAGNQADTCVKITTTTTTNTTTTTTTSTTTPSWPPEFSIGGIVGGTAGGVTALLATAVVVGACLWVRKAKEAIESPKVIVPMRDSLRNSISSPSYRANNGFIPFERLTFIKNLVGQNRRARTQRAVLTCPDTEESTHIALKAVLSGSAALEATAKENLKEELATLWSLSHPHLVKYMGWSMDDAQGVTYHVIMELKPSSLKQKLKSGPPAAIQVLQMALQVAQALEFLHSQKVGHGAIRPGNVLLETDNSVCLCGFGLTTDTPVTPSAFTAPEMAQAAAVTQPPTPPLDESGLVAKSEALPGYTRPLSVSYLTQIETCRGDCYSFAILLWLLCSWETPFPDQSGEEVASAAAGEHGIRPPLVDIQFWTTAVLDLMQQMWVADPKERPDMATACQTLVVCLTREQQGRIARSCTVQIARRVLTDAKTMYGLQIPKLVDVLSIPERTFGSSNYKEFYAAARSAGVPSRASQLLFACEMLVKLHAEKHLMDTADFLQKMNSQVPPLIREYMTFCVMVLGAEVCPQHNSS